MNTKIHPLQEKIIPILKELQYKYNKPITKAMLTLNRGYYPSVQEILNTIDHYSNEEPVKAFTKENNNLIEDVKNNNKENSSSLPDDSWNEPWWDFKSTNAFDSIKKVPLQSIEESISTALKQICDGDFKVTLTSFKQEGDQSIELTMKVHGMSN